MQTEAEWWAEDAERVNEGCRVAAELGVVIPMPNITPPRLKPDGSLADISENALFGLLGGKSKAAQQAGLLKGGTGGNCGVGSGGFQPGNTCAKGGGGKDITPYMEHVAKLTSTPEFKAWFKDSKVVDHNGDPKETASIEGITTSFAGHKPIVVYHGTPKGEFHEFKKDHIANPDHLHFGPGFYFTEDVKAAEEFSKGGHSASATGGQPKVMSYFLRSRKPFDADKDHIDPSTLPPADRAIVRSAIVQKALASDGRSEALEAGRAFDRGEHKMMYRELTDAAGVGGIGVSKTTVQKLLIEMGHDGITTQAPDVGEKGKNRYWIVFEPTQVKSTTNKGSFSESSADVRNLYEDVGTIVSIENVFCSTGKGGGVDATCGEGNGKASTDASGKGATPPIDKYGQRSKSGERHRTVSREHTHEGVPLKEAGAISKDDAKNAITWHDGMTQVGHNAPNPALPKESQPHLSDQQRGALQKYSYLNDRPMNRMLRGGDYSTDPASGGKTPYNKGFYEEMHTQLQSAFAATPVMKKPVQVVRGMKLDPETLKKFTDAAEHHAKDGSAISYDGYSSTAVKKGFAARLINGGHDLPAPFRGNVTMHIAAIHGIDMGPHSQLPGEAELLLNHQSKYTVKKVEKKSDGSVRIHLEQLPPENHKG